MKKFLLYLLFIHSLLFFSCENQNLASSSLAEPEYPVIQDLVDESMRDCLNVISAMKTKSGYSDPRLNTMEQVIQRALDPVKSLNKEELASDDELEAISALVDTSPELSAELERITAELQQKYAAIPPVEVLVEPLDENDQPIPGEAYTVVSEDGFIDFGDQAMRVDEYLRKMQNYEESIDKGFAVAHDFYGYCKKELWRHGRVTYFFGKNLTSSEKSWIRNEFKKISNVTEITFKEKPSNAWNNYHWELGYFCDHLKIYKGYMDPRGVSSIGKKDISYIKMHPDYINDSLWFDHEVGHVLGLLHEHQRYDRDSYIVVKDKFKNDKQVKKINKKNKYKILWWNYYRTNSTTKDTPSDYNSVMFYPKVYFTSLKNGNFNKWRVHKDNNLKWGHINGNTYFTPWDIYTIKRLYAIKNNPKPNYIPDGRDS